MGKPAPHTPVLYVKAGGAGGGGAGGGGGGNAGHGAPDYEKYPECGYASHPVDVVTGRAFTHPITDLFLPGPLPLEFRRMYSSTMHDQDMGLGWGWAHTFGWRIDVHADAIAVWNEQGVTVEFPLLADGEEVVGPWGWRLERNAGGYALDADDERIRHFTPEAEFSSRHRLSAIEDANGNRIVLTYDRGHLALVVDSAGRNIHFETTDDGRFRSIEVGVQGSGQRLRFASYAYDATGNLVTATDAEGFSARYEYDELHRLTADTDRCGLTFHFVYDREGRCVESWGDYGARPDPSLAGPLPQKLADGATPAKGIHHCRFTYGDDYYSEVADSQQTRRFFGTRFGTLERIVNGGSTITCAYDERGGLVSRTDACGATVSFERDERGRITSVHDPLGRTLSLRRDRLGLPVEILDPVGGVTRIERDARGNVVCVVDAAGGITTARYDHRGLVTEIVDPDGSRTTRTYDEQGNCVEVIGPNGGVWRMAFDALGREIAHTDPLGATTRTAYSARGDIVEIRTPQGGATRYVWDGERHLVEIVDANGGATRITWGGYHKVCDRRNANGDTVRFRYDAEGALVEIHNEAGETHSFHRNERGWLVAEDTFDGRHRRYRYDLCGRPTHITDALGQQTIYSYDAAGQRIGRCLADGTTEEYEYDDYGALVAVRWPGGEERFEYDALGNLRSELQCFDGQEFRVASTYDATGLRSALATSLGHSQAIERDSQGERRRTVLDGLHAIEHASDLLGREVLRTLPEGGRIESAFDTDGRLVQRRATAPRAHLSGAQEPVSLDSYVYDLNDNLIERHARDTGRTTFRHDPMGQLLAMVPERGRPEFFRFDSRRNLHEEGPEAEPREYGRGNRLLRKGRTLYSWDAEGQLTEKRTPEGVWRYSWTPVGLLRSVQRPDGKTVEFAYDPFARRLRKRIVTAVAAAGAGAAVQQTYYVWDDDVPVHEVRASSGAAHDITTYCFHDEGFEPLAHMDATGWAHYVNDPNGAPDRLVADDGSVTSVVRRRAWGVVAPGPTARRATPIGFQGQFHDEDVGLEYNRFRYYDADAGRYISPDPMGVVEDLNVFAFVADPFGMVDPYGLGVAAALARNMRRAGHGCRPGETPHHIVEREGGGRWGQRARACLRRNNIGINERDNGARLKGTAESQRVKGGHEKQCVGYHAGTDIHGDAAQKAIAQDLLAIEKKHGKGTKAAERALRKRLREIGAIQERRKPGNRHV